MKIYLECIPCFFKQALEAARFAGANQKTQKRILNEIARVIPRIPLNASPPEMGRIIYGAVERHTKLLMMHLLRMPFNAGLIRLQR